MSEAANISQLQNLPLPAPVSYFPQTWGWLALLLMVLGAALFFAGRAWWRWHLNRYRRAALAELLLIENAVGNDKRDALRQLPDLLKRTALAMPGQPKVASLQASAWQDFLQRCSTTALPADLSRQLAELSYAPDQQLQALADARVQELLGVCRHWLEQHHVAV